MWQSLALLTHQLPGHAAMLQSMACCSQMHVLSNAVADTGIFLGGQPAMRNTGLYQQV
jgi:hypothetical protein